MNVCRWTLCGLVLMGAAGAQAPIRVTVVHPTRADVARTLSLAGDVRPQAMVMIRSPITGFAKRPRVDRGSRVKRGDLLVELDVPERVHDRKLLEIERRAAEDSVRAARARVAELESLVAAASARADAARVAVGAREVSVRFAEKNHERTLKLRRDGSATPRDVELSEEQLLTSRAELEAARAESATRAADVTSAQRAVERALVDLELRRRDVEAAGARLERFDAVAALTRITAPFDGIVTARMVDEGALVLGSDRTSDATALFTVIEPAPARVVIPLPETEVTHLRKNAPATITGPTMPQEGITATVTLDAGALTNDNRTLPVELHVDDDRLICGASVWVTLTLERHVDVLTIPAEAVHFEKKKPFVWIVVDGRAKKVPVTLGFNDLVRAEVRDVDAGAEIVVEAARPLSEGAVVRTNARREQR